jgi:hypothetical protein
VSNFSSAGGTTAGTPAREGNNIMIYLVDSGRSGDVRESASN